MITNSWLKLMQPTDQAEYNLICLPFAGGYAEYFLPWRNVLKSNMQLCPLQLPGRSYRWQDKPITDVNILLNDLLPTIQPLLTDKPYILFGHSMGGYIAYKLARMLGENALPLPRLLVVSAVPAPIHWLVRKRLNSLSQEEFYNFFLKLGGIHPELLKHEKFITMQMDLLRSDIAICESCEYKNPALFPFPILSLAGSQDEFVPFPSMADWQQETTKSFSLHEFTGNHFYLNNHIPALLELIDKRMLAC